METSEKVPIQEMKEYTESYRNIEIQGSKAFIAETKKALDLLINNKSFREVHSFIGKIKEARSSGMRAYDEIPTYEAGKATWTHSTIWYAGTIAHDGYHSLLYHKEKKRSKGIEPNPDSWTGTSAEKRCIEFQLKVLMELSAEDYLIRYLQQQLKNPTYQDIPYNERYW